MRVVSNCWSCWPDRWVWRSAFEAADRLELLLKQVLNLARFGLELPTISADVQLGAAELASVCQMAAARSGLLLAHSEFEPGLCWVWTVKLLRFVGKGYCPFESFQSCSQRLGLPCA
mmetsp:Transcript_18700/g.31258  ORF Transcript_18700/g.31258 Transcript_18700/m.31258 type:complete len:117 (+) Transcript_18700:201-551(+)